MSDDDCEDQGMAATNRCTKCRIGFDLNDKPVSPRLEWRGRYWCCPNCSASYGENPAFKLPAKPRGCDAMSDELNIVINGQALTAVQAMAVQVAITSFHAGMAEADALGGDEHGRRMTAAYRDRLSEVLGLMQMSDKPARELLPGEAEVDAWIDTLGQRADAMSDDKLPPLDKVIAEIERLRAEIERLWGPYRLAAQAMRSTI